MTPTKNILMVINTLGNGGAERAVSLISRHLSTTDCRVQIMCLERNIFDNDNFYQLPDTIPIHYLTHEKSTHSGLKKLLQLPILAWQLMQFIEQHQISVVQSHLFRASYVSAMAKLWMKLRRRATPTLQMVTPGQITYYDQEGLLGKVNLFLIRWCYPLSSLLIFKSKEMQAQANQRLPNLTQSAQTVIYNPYDIEHIQQQASLPISFVFDANKRYLVSVGRLIKLKRTETILNVLPQLPDEVELILVGNGAEEDHFKQIAQQNQIAHRVHFVGAQKNPFAWVAHANVFILSSETEGFPNVLAEAMICQTPVIASDCISGPREILAPETDPLNHLQKGDAFEITPNGILYAVGDEVQLLKAITYLLANPEKAQTLADRAFLRAHDFSLATIMAQYKHHLCPQA